RHIGVELNVKDWETIGFDVPLMVNMQPAGEYLGESFFRAGGVPAVMGELLKAGRIHVQAMTATGHTMGANLAGIESQDRNVVTSYDAPMRKNAGFKVLSGNLFDSALMKTSVISQDFRERFLSEPGNEGVFEARAVVFEGPEDYHERINDADLNIDERTILFIRGVGCVGYPGSAEVVNMQPPDAVIRQGVNHLPTVGDGRQSGTSESPSILNASPESVVGGGLAHLRTGDMVRLDLNSSRMDALVPEDEWQARIDAWQPPEIVSQTPWQEIYRRHVGQLADGGCLELATAYQKVRNALPRDNH
ncbi:MAG TPA: dihydroxy-acid dehydratase, partial [Ruegeria sp.]|nr:dihydroxy-acid dehydratase [Ruegeria sp.]